MDLSKLSDAEFAALKASLGPAAPPAPPAPPPTLKDRIRQLMDASRDTAAGALRGTGSIGATLLAPADVASDAMAGRPLMQSNRERRAAMDAALGTMGADTNSAMYQVGKAGTEIAGTAGAGGMLARGATMAGLPANVARLLEAGGLVQGGGYVPKVAAGAVAGGAGAGLVDPEDAAGGAGIGALIPGAAPLVRAVTRSGVKYPALASAAQRLNIPVGPAAISDAPLLKGARSVLNDVLVTGSIGRSQDDAVKRALTREVGRTFDQPLEELTPQAMMQAKDALGRRFDDVWGRNALIVDGPMMDRVIALRNESSGLPADTARIINHQTQEFLTKVQGGDPANGIMWVDGDTANAFQRRLRELGEGNANFRDTYGDLRGMILGAFNRNVDPADAALLADTQRKYRAFKTVEPLMAKGDVGVGAAEMNQVPAGLLPGAVLKQYGERASQGPFAELAPIAGNFVADKVARTGGSARALAQQSALNAGAVLGLGGTSMASLPLAGGLAGALAGGQWAMGSPLLGRLATARANNRVLADPVAELLRQDPRLLGGAVAGSGGLYAD